MTAPKKTRPVGVATRPQLELTPNQLRVAQLFASMDEDTQVDVIPIIESWAIKFSRHNRPALRLVAGGPK